MSLKSRLVSIASVTGLIVLVSGCAAVGIGGTVDTRWADFKTWDKVTDGQTGDPTKFIGNVHRGPSGFRNVYVNASGLETINDESEGRVFPAGAIVIKEQFKNEAAWKSGKGGGYTVMIKQEDGQWGWTDSLKGKAGPSAFCAGCHGIAAKHDAVFTGGGYEN